MAEKNNVLDIVRGISSAVATAYDGALDEKGEPIKIGLSREEGNVILDKRIMDGFGVSLSGNTMTIKYQGNIRLSDVHGGKFEQEIAQKLEDISSYLKKQYKKITGNSLSLTKIGKEPEILVQSLSRIRSLVNARCSYKIGGMPEEPELGQTTDERLDNSIKKWLGMGKDEFPNTKKAKNVTGKRDEDPRT
tara:strand:- start:1118 stop:1690 length:573 start_codon:yes stop_codon:yes gene_type:complete